MSTLPISECESRNLNWISNFDTKDLYTYHDIIDAYQEHKPESRFFISRYAQDCNGRHLRSHYSLWGNNVDRDAFYFIWKAFKNQLEDFIKKDEFIL